MELEFDTPSYYFFIVTGIFGLTTLVWILFRYIKHPITAFYRLARLPLLIRRQRWDSVTRLEAIVLGIYFSTNAVLLFAPFNSFEWRKAEKRFALIAVVNLLPLCVGMRMGPVQVFNFHRTSLRLFHHWIGRMAILEALCHAIIVMSKKPRLGTLVYTGYGASGGFFLCFILSLIWVRHFQGAWFILTHRVIVVASFAVLCWHMLYVANPVAHWVVGVSGGALLILIAMSAWRRAFPQYSAHVSTIKRYPHARVVVVEAELKTPATVEPGAYFRVAFPKNGIHLRSYPMVALCSSQDRSSPGDTTRLKFLFSTDRSWRNSLRSLKAEDKLTLDGPYGQNMHLRSYDRVILVAQGVGIVGVLPLIFHLAERRRHDDSLNNELNEHWKLRQSLFKESANSTVSDELSSRRQKWLDRRAEIEGKRRFLDATRKVVLLWMLEDSAQMEPVESELRKLQDLDPYNRFLVVWCGYPQKRQGLDPFKISGPQEQPFWKCWDRDRLKFQQIILDKIAEERERLPGRIVVTACGDPDFTNYVRNGTISCCQRDPIYFFETEYRPRASGLKGGLGVEV